MLRTFVLSVGAFSPSVLYVESQTPVFMCSMTWEDPCQRSCCILIVLGCVKSSLPFVHKFLVRWSESLLE